LAARGLIDPVDCAIFADTGSEPKAVYAHLRWLESVLQFPVHHVSAGNLKAEILGAMSDGSNRIDGRPPFLTGSGGMLNRQCTGDYKIVPIQRKVRELAGIARGARGPKHVTVEQMIGISTDEASRMKDSRFRWLLHRFPLIERGMSRRDCLKWLLDHGYPTPPKSGELYT
jgi:3'-phosphoadenosine 5'-phosphosulfate sulfotransferase (PAPS reductase)/FAD synthetase